MMNRVMYIHPCLYIQRPEHIAHTPPPRRAEIRRYAPREADMKPFPNAFLGDIRWFSADKTPASYAGGVGEALRRHIRYIRRGGLSNIERDFIKTCLEELDRRVNARIAGKFLFTLPNDMDESTASGFVYEVMQAVGEVQYLFAVHRDTGALSGKQNAHVHIVFATRDKAGVKIRLGRRELSSLHKHYRQVLLRYGYEPLANPAGKQHHVGPIARRPTGPNQARNQVQIVLNLREAWRAMDEKSKPRPRPATEPQKRRAEKKKLTPGIKETQPQHWWMWWTEDMNPVGGPQR